MKKRNLLLNIALITMILQVSNYTSVNAISNTTENINTEIVSSMSKINKQSNKIIIFKKNLDKSKSELEKTKVEYNKRSQNFNEISKLYFMNILNLNDIDTKSSYDNSNKSYNDLWLLKKNTHAEVTITKQIVNKAQSNFYLANNILKQMINYKAKETKKLQKNQQIVERILNENNKIDALTKQTSLEIINKYLSNNDNGPTRNNILRFSTLFLGMPYQWGGSNPNESFDCSGLTQYVFNKFDITLPRVAAEQQQMGTEVSFSDAKLCDLIFFGAPAHHVGIYLGNGYMLHAPHTGESIKVSRINTPTNVRRIIKD